MKLATERSGDPDGRLLVVSSDLSLVVAADQIAPNLLKALERWDLVNPALQDLSDRLNFGAEVNAKPFDASRLSAPLPRTWQWLDASAYRVHGELMQKAFKHPPLVTNPPLMYQGMSHRFLGPTENVVLPDPAHGIDFEGEFGVITGHVGMGASAQAALGAVLLLVQINDWSLRTLGAAEMKTGFGWVTAKPACSMAPVAVTPDELGSAWNGGQLKARLEVRLNGEQFGDVDSAGMEFGFDQLISHAAKTRELCAGTVIGSGTVSSPKYREQGSCCIAERRAIEAIDHGSAQTGFLSDGDRVEMTARVAGIDGRPFGTIDQQLSVAPAH